MKMSEHPALVLPPTAAEATKSTDPLSDQHSTSHVLVLPVQKKISGMQIALSLENSRVPNYGSMLKTNKRQHIGNTRGTKIVARNGERMSPTSIRGEQKPTRTLLFRGTPKAQGAELQQSATGGKHSQSRLGIG